jgi:aromatic-L-amino-acid/L-tryptophan decarboxylase
VPWRPDPSTVAFRIRPRGPGAEAKERPTRRPGVCWNRVDAHRRVRLSSTVIENRRTLRVRVVSHRTHRDRVAEAVDLIVSEAG